MTGGRLRTTSRRRSRRAAWTFADSDHGAQEDAAAFRSLVDDGCVVEVHEESPSDLLTTPFCEPKAFDIGVFYE